MKNAFITSSLLLSLCGTGCVATRKYVAKSISPVEQHVTTVESKNDSKNADQDKALTENKTQIENVDRDLSRTKERLSDTDAKVVAMNSTVSTIDAKATAANAAASAADGKAQTSLEKNGQLTQSVDSFKNAYKMDKLKLVKSDTVLFGFNRRSLTDEAKAQLDAVGQSLNGLGKYVVEVQGFTDKIGGAAYNNELSQERAEAVARYLANQHKVPLHNITMLGSGEADGDQKTRTEREQSRKVDIRIFVPEI